MLTSNVIDEKEARKSILEVIKDIGEKLSKSLGPYGSTTIMKDSLNINHQITKDGYSILKAINYKEQLPKTILEIVKKISYELVKEVGDGSTSSILIAYSLFFNIDFLLEKEKISTRLLLEFFDELEKVIEKKLKEKALPISLEENPEVIRKIATVANNNNSKLGNLIEEIYSKIGKDGFIDIQISPNTEDDYKIIKGYELYRGYSNEIFVNKNDKITCELNNCKVLLVDDIIDESDLEELSEILGSICLSLKKSLFIIAKGFSSEVRNFFVINKHNNPNLDICFTEFSFATQHNVDKFDDLAAYLGGKVIRKSIGEKISFTDDIQKLGECRKVICTNKETTFVEGLAPEEMIKAREEYIERQMKEVKEKESYVDISDDVYLLNKRLADMHNNIATIFVGGQSDIEKETRRYLVEDSIYACKSALQKGYVIGGNLIIPIIMRSYHDEIIQAIYDNSLVISRELDKQIAEKIFIAIRNAFDFSFKQVLRNKYLENNDKIDNIFEECMTRKSVFNLLTEEFEDINNTSIINSSDTDLQIMKSTFSIIGLLVTSNQFIGTDFIRDEKLF